eukprot:403359773
MGLCCSAQNSHADWQNQQPGEMDINIDVIELARQHPERWELTELKNDEVIYFHDHSLEKIEQNQRIGWICDGGKPPFSKCFSGITDFHQSDKLGIQGWVCWQCNWDFCEKCIKAAHYINKVQQQRAKIPYSAKNMRGGKINSFYEVKDNTQNSQQGTR